MIPNLPRPFLWTEKKTMDEFLKGERVANLLYNNFHWLQKCHSLPVVDELVFFNELYYQLTRYYYEKPQSEDYPRYEADIKQNIGDECYVDLLMTMMYHYCRLRIASSEKLLTDGFLQVIVNNQCKKKYWSHFRTIASSGFFWLTPVPYPQKPCPVAPEKLEKMKLNWAEITKDYNLSSVQEILELWEKEDDKREVAKIMKSRIMVSFNRVFHKRDFSSVAKYLDKVIGKDKDVAKEYSTEYVESLKRTIDDDKKIIAQLEKENSLLSDQNKQISILQQKNNKLKERIEEDEARMLGGFGAMVISKDEDENILMDSHVIDTDKNKALLESQKQNEVSRRQVEEVKQQMDKLRDNLENKIKELQDKLGKETVQLSVLAEGIKNLSEEAGIDAAYNLFLHLNTMLINIPTWTKNVPELNKFFRDARKEKEKSITNIGQQNNFENVGSYNEKVATQNNNYPAMPFGQQGQKQLEK